MDAGLFSSSMQMSNRDQVGGGGFGGGDAAASRKAPLFSMLQKQVLIVTSAIRTDMTGSLWESGLTSEAPHHLSGAVLRLLSRSLSLFDCV